MSETIKCKSKQSISVSSDDPNGRDANVIDVEAYAGQGGYRIYRFTFVNFDFAAVKSKLAGKEITGIKLCVYISGKSDRPPDNESDPYSRLYFVHYLVVKNWDTSLTYNKSLNLAYEDSNIGRVVPTNIVDQGWQSFAITIPNGKLENYNFLTCLENYGIKLAAVNDYYDRGIINYWSLYRDVQAYPPYLELTCEDITPEARNLAPSSGQIRSDANNSFSWSFYAGGENVFEIPKHQASKFCWRTAESEAPQEIFLPGAQTRYTVPAGTFQTAKVQWQALVQASNGAWSSSSTWITLDVINDKPTPLIVSPQGAYTNGGQNITFSWRYAGTTAGFSQSRAELTYSTDSASYRTLATVSGQSLSYVLPRNTLPSGRIWWRLRSYNQSGAASPWTEAAEIVIYNSAPQPAITSVSNQARPTISWTAVGQVAFALQIKNSAGSLVFQADEVARGETSFRVPDFLPNGSYTFLLRTKNVGGVWSVWVSRAASISVQIPPKPQISVAGIRNGARITTALQSGATLYMLRDDVPIAKFTSNVYDDFGAVGSHTYKVRAVSAAGGYCDSNSVRFGVTVQGAIIAPCKALAEMINVDSSRDSGASKFAGTLDSRGAELYFSGRDYPVFIFPGSLSQRHTITFATYDSTLSRRVLALAQSKQTVLYRDDLGNSYYAVILTDGFTENGIIKTHTLELARVGYNERIEYT